MNQSEQQRIAELLKRSLPEVNDDRAQLSRDLWPAMLRRLQRQPASAACSERAGFNQAWVWFDCALAAAAVAWLAFFPPAILVLLYHL